MVDVRRFVNNLENVDNQGRATNSVDVELRNWCIAIDRFNYNPQYDPTLLAIRPHIAQWLPASARMLLRAFL